VQEYASEFWAQTKYACFEGGHIVQVSARKSVVCIALLVCSSLRQSCELVGFVSISVNSSCDLQAAVSAILLVLFVTLSGMFTLLVFDSHPLSPNPLAKAHGRADLIFLVCKVFARTRRMAHDTVQTQRQNHCHFVFVFYLGYSRRSCRRLATGGGPLDCNVRHPCVCFIVGDLLRCADAHVSS
jgi:hypothetical protein